MISGGMENSVTGALSRISIMSIYQDGRGNIWAGTHQDGAYRIDVSGNTVNYRHQYGAGIQAFDNEEPILLENNTDADAGKPAVLLVDDNESLLEILTDSLAAYYSVYTAVNGREGLDMA